jgi:hypothetical protein
MKFEDFIQEGKKITLKRQYTENHPAITVGKSARVRNKMLEAVADGKITQEEFDNILKEYSSNSSKWMKRNAKFFNVSEEGISLTGFGKKALSAISINENESVNEAKSFEFTINYNTGDDDKAYVEEVLLARGVDATVEYGTLEDDIIIKTKNAAELRKAKKVIQADGFEINESVVNEGVGTIALGVMLAWAGLKVLGVIAKKVIGKIAFNAELPPEKLKKVVADMVKNISKKTGSAEVLLVGTAVKIDLDRKIDAGELKTVNDLKRAMENYLKTNEGNAFGAARAKAIADGEDSFEVDGETYPVEDVDKEDKENAEEFAGESIVTESMELKKLEDAIKIFQDKIKSQGRVTNARDEEHLENLIRIYKEMGGKNIKESTSNEATSDSFIIESFSKFVESLNESEMLTEAFKSMKLAQLLTPKKKTSWNQGIAQEFYNYTKVKMDKIEDHDLLEVDPQVAYKQKGGTKVKFFLIDNEKQSPYTEDTYDGKIPAGLIAVLDGNNDFMGAVYKRFGSDKGRVLTKTDKGDSLGVDKRRKGYGATGLSSAKKIADFADRAIVIDIDILRQRYSAEQQRTERAAAQKGAIAFKSDKEFKAENMARYKEILANKAAALPLDKMVNDAIDKIAAQIKEGLAKGEKTNYGEIKIGENKRGSAVKMRDAANHMQNILDNYDRYVNYITQAEQEKAEWGKENSYYAAESKTYAKEVKDKINQIDNFDYAW